MEDNINIIINNMLAVNKKNLPKETINLILNQIKASLLNSKEALVVANNIDTKNNNGFKLDFEIFNNIFKNIEDETYSGDIIYSQKNEVKKFVYSKFWESKGNVVIINDGNTYILLELILKNIIANNNVIINTNGYMYGTNNFLIGIIQTILEKNSYSKNQIQLFLSEDYEDIFKHYTSIDLVVAIGNSQLQRIVQKNCQNELIISGYENFDIYIETDKYLDFVKKIIEQNINVQFYINKELSFDEENAILVDDIEEAVAQINFNGSGYSAAIFTEDKASAEYFMNNVKSKIHTINTSPSIERILDINTENLMIEKTVIVPLNEGGESIKFDINTLFSEK